MIAHLHVLPRHWQAFMAHQKEQDSSTIFIDLSVLKLRGELNVANILPDGESPLVLFALDCLSEEEQQSVNDWIKEQTRQLTLIEATFKQNDWYPTVIDSALLPPILRQQSNQIQESYLRRKRYFSDASMDSIDILNETLSSWQLSGEYENAIGQIHRPFQPNMPLEHCYIHEKLYRRLMQWLSVESGSKLSWQSRFNASHRGLLLYGPSGCGKSCIIQAILTGFVHQRPIYSVTATELLGKYLGESEERLRKVFQSLNKEQNPILLIEGLDLLGRKRTERNDEEMESSIHRRLLTTLLTLLDGIDTQHSIKVIGMTRQPWLLDDALLRPGRFDTLIPILPPNDVTEIPALVAAIMKQMKMEDNYQELTSWLQKHIGKWRPSQIVQCVQQYKLVKKSWSNIASQIIDIHSNSLQTQIERIELFNRS